MKDLPYQPYLNKITGNNGFIAALDQSGGSTPKALRLYGIAESEYSNEEEMFEKIHQMRTRIITSKSFTGDRILGAILFEKTMNGEISGMDTAQYLWNKKQVVPFLKVDKGLEQVNDGVQLMKPNPGLEDLLDQAVNKDIFGTKMRSVIKDANEKGVAAVVGQQFEIAKIIIQKNLVPIIEPEVDIHCENKSVAEQMLFENLMNQIEHLTAEQKILLKLTIPNKINLYAPFINHPNVLRVFALSGGYSREEANKLLALNNGMLASFSRALTEGLTAQQSDGEFNSVLDASIESIYQSSLS
ncbi:MAG: fructose bisphosphate aldolase [SAR324 cluster bacterium]|nr:fructose bisphosphate aldolase [SAR324 cluster bacterium]